MVNLLCGARRVDQPAGPGRETPYRGGGGGGGEPPPSLSLSLSLVRRLKFHANAAMKILVHRAYMCMHWTGVTAAFS
jgi:hypothetical protein